jgi:hypothetical protein
MRFAVSLLAPILVVHPAVLQAQAANPVQTLSFLSGRWTSDSTEDSEEEYWSPVMGESMVGHFRVVAKGKAGAQKAVFYEFWAIELEDGKPIFKRKHFHHGLQGWEEKNDVVRLETKFEDAQTVVFTRPTARSISAISARATS